MAARETMVILVLPWGSETVQRFKSKKVARVAAETLVQQYARLDLEVFEDADGDFVVRADDD